MPNGSPNRSSNPGHLLLGPLTWGKVDAEIYSVQDSPNEQMTSCSATEESINDQDVNRRNF